MTRTGDLPVSFGSQTPREFFATNPVILISGERPGAGASTLAEGIGREVLNLGFANIYACNIGKDIRGSVGA